MGRNYYYSTEEYIWLGIHILFTCFLTRAGSMSGTCRIENLAVTLAGMTVFVPGSEKAPSMPWMETVGQRHMWASRSTYRKHTMTVMYIVVPPCLKSFSRLYPNLVAVHKLVDTNLALVVVKVKLDVLVHFPFFVREGSHSLPNPRDQDFTAGADQCV